MGKIKNIIFDFGGVIMELDYHKAVRAFQNLGLKDAGTQLDPYTQSGIFGDLECGKITDEEFRTTLSGMIGRELSWKECQTAWMGYRKNLPLRNLLVMKKLRTEGYHVILLSNTNPFMMGWVLSDEFDGEGHSLKYYIDTIYLSYECKMMKPQKELFQLIVDKEGINPSETLFIDDSMKNAKAGEAFGFNVFCPPEGSDWTKEIYNHL